MERTSPMAGGRRLMLTLWLALVMSLGGVAMPVAAQPADGTISGRVVDGRTGRPLPGTVVTLGYETLQRATETDGAGVYRFTSVPPSRNIDVIVFRAGYTYLLQNTTIGAGQQVSLDFRIIPEPNPGLIPTIGEPAIGTISAEPGQEVTFSLRVRQGSEVPLSPEVMATNPVLGRLVLLKPGPDGRWSAAWRVPDDAPEGEYAWTFVAVDEACREPSAFPVLSLAITRRRLFPETGKTVPGIFHHYWQTHGGLPLYGYPISEVVQEVSPTDGKPYLVQYFERNRFEYHSELAGTPWEVLLGLLGRQVTAGREGEAPFQRIARVADTPARRYFDATGHSLGATPAFLAYWERNGGLAQFGYPISEEFVERNPTDGQDYTVQYFERARFEYHPEFQGTAFEVLLGHLGRQVYRG